MRRSSAWPSINVLILVIVISGSEGAQQKCLNGLNFTPPNRHFYYEFVNGNHSIIELPITIATTNTVSHHISATLFSIYLQEAYGYRNVILVNEDDAKQDLNTSLKRLNNYKGDVPEAMLDLEVWLSPGSTERNANVTFVGSHKSSARFNWYISSHGENTTMQGVDYSRLVDSDITQKLSFTSRQRRIIELQARSYHVEVSKTNSSCKDSRCKEGVFTPDRCRVKKCALLLAAFYYDTSFLIRQIDTDELLVEVAWIGHTLTPHFVRSFPQNQYIMFFERWPSPFSALEGFRPLSFPRCYDDDTQDYFYNYEIHSMKKYIWKNLEEKVPLISKALDRFILDNKDYKEMMKSYVDKMDQRSYKGLVHKDIVNQVACDWWRRKIQTSPRDVTPNDSTKENIWIGGIFFISGNEASDTILPKIAQMAVNRVNNDSSILPNYNLILLERNGACNVDVISHFISYMRFNVENLNKMAGILGPGCSAQVQPLVELARKNNYTVLSYSSEGAILNSSANFFRTIPENLVFSEVYKSLFAELKWKNIVTFSESGNKYSDYMTTLKMAPGNLSIVHDNYLTQNNNLTSVLKRHKTDNKRVFIGDFNDATSRKVMCAAYHEKMTAKEGYVYFLPRWLKKEWYNTSKHDGPIDCTTQQILEVINGYMSLSYSHYAKDNYKTTEGITVEEWKEEYNQELNTTEAPVDYAGYIYDAVWMYAYALRDLLSENDSFATNFQNNHTYNRFSEILKTTNFSGVSGHVNFKNGTSRKALVEIFQFVHDPDTQKASHGIVGTYDPDIGLGMLTLNSSSILWQTKDSKPPSDGTLPNPCLLSPLDHLLGVSCPTATIIVVVVVFATITGIVTIACVIFVHRVNKLQKEKQELNAKLDLPMVDGMEIQRDRVVILRKIGTGAFSLVYGGECQLTDTSEWTAIAVKTLEGSTAEKRLEFLKEAEIMRKFIHPNIVKLFGVATTEEPMWMIMEFVLYGDLKKYLIDRRQMVHLDRYDVEVCPRTLTNMALGIASALEYLHSLNFVHRDVACRNCLVGKDRTAKLSDFGLTRHITTESNYYRLCRTGLVPVRWMAPESISNQVYTSHSDMWSYGVMLYELITFGNHPFKNLNHNQVMTHVLSGKTLTPPRNIKPQLTELLLQCWQKKPEKRPSFKDIVNLMKEKPDLITACLNDPTRCVNSYDRFVVPQHNGNSTPKPPTQPITKQPIIPEDEESMEPLLFSKPQPSPQLQMQNYPISTDPSRDPLLVSSGSGRDPLLVPVGNINPRHVNFIRQNESIL